MAATNPPFFLLRIATSDQGWTNNEIFAQWFAQVFIPFAQGRNKSGTSILLIIDGHASHETPEVQQLCYAASPPVILYCLPPKTTHKLQPLDVGVFGPLQNAWAKHVQECAAQNRSVTRETIIEEYLKIHGKYMSAKVIQSAFCHCGIWPFNPQIFMVADFAPSKMTSTCSTAPPSYPAEVPSSPSTAMMTDSDMDNLMYCSSSDMSGDGAEGSSDAGEDDEDKDGDKDGHAHAVSSPPHPLCAHALSSHSTWPSPKTLPPSPALMTLQGSIHTPTS